MDDFVAHMSDGGMAQRKKDVVPRERASTTRAREEE